MKVLFTFGGIPHYLNAMLNRLQAKGVEITVVSPKKGNTTIGKGVKMVEGGTYKHLTTPEKKMFYGKSAFPALPEIIAEEKPDIVVVGWPYFLQVFFQPALRKAMKSCNAKLVIREIPFQTPPYGIFQSQSDARRRYAPAQQGYRLLSAPMDNGKDTEILLRPSRRNAELLDSRLRHPPLLRSKEGADTRHLQLDRYGSTSQRKRIRTGFPLHPSPVRPSPAAHRTARKMEIEAFRKVATDYPEAELVIVGDGPELDNLRQQANDLQLADSIRFIGAVYDPKTLGAYMNESSIYVLAGMGGLSINDAMTYGMPVLCAVCDSTERDLVMEGKNGYFFKDGDADSLAGRIREMFESPERCKEMGKESERMIREKINMETVSERYLKAFQEILRLTHLRDSGN